MKMSCAISSRSVMVFIQRRTTGVAFSTAAEGLAASGDFPGTAPLRATVELGTAPAADAMIMAAAVKRYKEKTTIPVCQIHRPSALFPVLERSRFCDAGGFRTVRLSSRLTARARFA